MRRIQPFLNRLLMFFEDRLTNVYSSSNKWLHLLIMPLYHLHRLIMVPQGGLSFDAYLLTGCVQGGETEITVGYLYSGKNLRYIAGRLFHEGRYQEKKLGRYWVWQQARAAEALAQQSDMVIVQRISLLSWKPRRGEWVISPTSVRMVRTLDPDMPWEEVSRSFKKHERNIRRFKRAGYTYEISRDDADFDFFYERMYLPFAKTRHHDTFIITPKSELYAHFKEGFMLFILDAEGNRVAADLDCMIGEVFYPLSCGILDGEAKYLDDGALSALYYYALKVSHEMGYRRSDVCDTSPFKNDGIYQYKRRWGYEPQMDLWNARERLFWVPNGSPAARQWLADNPFVDEFTQTSGSRSDSSLQTQPSGD